LAIEDAMKSEIRSSWVLTARRLIEELHPAAKSEMVRYLPRPHANVLDDAVPGEWYPEEVLSGLLHGLYEVLAEGDAARFETLLERAVELGIHRFFSAVLKLSSPGFVLARVPTLWGLTRRGAGRVTVERGPEGSLVRYHDFPYFDLERYRVLTRASIRTLLRQTKIANPEVEIVHYTSSSCDILGRHR
jgi:hypothetical protein